MIPAFTVCIHCAGPSRPISISRPATCAPPSCCSVIILRLDPTLGSLQLALQLAVLVLKVADLLPHLRGTGDLLLEGEQLDGMSAVLAMPGGLDAPESV